MQFRTEIKDGVAYCDVGDTAVFLWRDPASAARWQWVVSRLEALSAKHRRGVLCLYVITASSTPPSATLRAQMQADFRRLDDRMRKMIVVPVGDSIWTSVVRTLARGILLLSGQSARQEMADGVADGIARIQKLATPDTPTTEQLTAAVEALDAALASPASRPRA